MSTTSSRNFTTLYSGSGSVVPQGAYGNANVVSLLSVGTDGGNTVSNIVATGNITTTAQISAQGNITTAGYFVGSLVGNVSGNVTAAGSNTQVQFNNNGVLGADADFTYNNGTNALTVTGNITGGNLLTGGAITATGNVTAANFFGNVFGNIVGNVDAAGSDTQIQFNTGNVLDASANLTFDKSTNVLKVTGNASFPTSGIEISNNTLTGNLALGNLLITNQFQGTSRGAVVVDTNEFIVGQDNAALGTNAIVRGIRNQALELTTTNAGAPSVYVGKYVSGSASLTGNVDTRSSNVGGYAGTGNINLSGNVYVSRNAQGADATFGKANLIVSDSVYVNQNVSVAGNTTSGNLISSGVVTSSGNVIGGNITTLGQISATGNVQGGNIRTTGTISATGNIITDGYFLGNVANASGIFASRIFNGTSEANIGTSGGNANITIGGTSNVVVVSTTGVSVAGILTATGNVLSGNVNTGGVVSAIGNIISGNFVTDGNLYGNVVGQIFAGAGSSNVTIQQNGAFGSATTALNLRANTIVFGNGPFPGGATLLTPVATGMEIGVGGSIGSGPSITLVNAESGGNLNLAAWGVGTTGRVNLVGNTHIGGSAFPTARANLIVGASAYVGGQISVAGNVTAGTGNYFLGDGGLLSNITTSSATQLVNGTSNVKIATANSNITMSVNGTSNVVIVTGSGANIAGYASVSGNIIGGNVTAAANVSGGNVAAVANVSGGNIIASGQVSATGNITGNYFIGNGSQLTGILSNSNQIVNGTSNVKIAAANSNITMSVNGFSDVVIVTGTGANIAGYAEVTGNIVGGNVAAVANVSGGNISTSGQISAAGNITSGSGSYFIGNGSLLTGIISSYGNANVSNFLANGFGSNVILTTGNINGGNLVASANLTSTQQTVVGTGNITGGTGNIILSGKNIATDMAFNPDGGNATNSALSRIVVGTGWLGNITHDVRQNRLMVQDTFARGNTGTAVQLFASDPIVSLTGNVTNGSFRVQGVASRVRIGGGPDGNTLIASVGVGSVGSVAALQPNIDVGNISPYFLGNTIVNQAVLNGGFILPYTGSTVNNAYGMIPGLNQGGGNIVNYIGFASQLNGMSAGSVTGNVYGVYHGSNTTQSITGIGTNNVVRSAPGYYAFYNADDVAQVKLGSLRSYNEFQYSTATSGTVNIDKNNAQIQYIAPTANVTIGSFQNFVTTASNSVSDINQTDTVTLIIKQGATPYTVTMPTGNAAIKYASGNSTVGSTANAVTMISVSAANVAGAALYMVTVSPEFT
jgi:hypothetical protein